MWKSVVPTICVFSYHQDMIRFPIGLCIYHYYYYVIHLIRRKGWVFFHLLYMLYSWVFQIRSTICRSQRSCGIHNSCTSFSARRTEYVLYSKGLYGCCLIVPVAVAIQRLIFSYIFVTLCRRFMFFVFQFGILNVWIC